MRPFPLVARHRDEQGLIIEVGPVKIGGPELVVMAGPCAVESREQMLLSAQLMKARGAHILRGGAFKPRTSPYSFQGLEELGLKYLAEARELTGMPVVTEVMDTRELPMICYYADIIQVGSRNMQNFALLKEVGRINKPVLLKRGLSATIEEWLMAAEYIAEAGNPNIILCERGIRTFESFTRNTLDLSAVLAAKEMAKLPVIVDPSHATGRWQMVSPLAKASVAVGADGLLIEVHPNPDEALCDGPQSLNPDKFAVLMGDLDLVAEAVGRKLPRNHELSSRV